ncbi:WD40-repeat-containing domain protein [Syncephalastrum racemosum]|uniref:WD repeat-containing protein JIP5 n=1 Tax=Syncephalastrum racemosum TaxID=13706 RepID=A0A1X2HNN7_SYNRA|nr:WD40-repeat-containing domain protein [Syncephalastrum racemosum]
MYNLKSPAPLDLGKQALDFALHPSQDLLVSGLITGKVDCHRYGLEKHDLLWREKVFKKSCRGVVFNPDGSQIYSISKDKSIFCLDTETGKTVSSKEDAHEEPPCTLLCLNENMIATGDDQGVIKLWDNRKQDPVMVYSEHEDFIADMAFNADKRTLVVAGGDGYLSTWDIRKKDVVAMSDHMEDELLSVTLVKNGQKALVGSQEGILSLWTWGDWGDYKDRIVGHPNSIDSICKLDEDTVCTASGDGLIRLVGILPNEFHGIIGDHGDQMPVEHLGLTHDKKYLLSSGHDTSIRFWDVGHLFSEEDEVAEGETEKEKEEDKSGKDAAQDSDDDDDDDDDDSDEEPKKKAKGKKRKQKAKQQYQPPKKRNTAFFADL